MTPEQVREYQREYQKAWRARNPEKWAAIQRKNREKNREKNYAARDTWRELNRDRERETGAAYRAANRLRQHSRLSEDEHAAMWIAQDGRCYLCAEPMTVGN